MKPTVVDTERKTKEENNDACAKYDSKKQEGRCNKAYEDCIAHMLNKKAEGNFNNLSLPNGKFLRTSQLKYDWPIGLEEMQRVRTAGEKDELIRMLF